MCTHLRGDLALLRVAARLLLGADELLALGVVPALALGRAVVVVVLHRGLHVLRERDAADERLEALAAEHRAEDLLGVDEAALGLALARPELVVLFPERGVGERLVRDRDFLYGLGVRRSKPDEGRGAYLEPLLGVGVVPVLIGVVFDSCSPYMH
jgi:hypothetical protein